MAELPENIAVGDPGHPEHHNTIHSLLERLDDQTGPPYAFQAGGYATGTLAARPVASAANQDFCYYAYDTQQKFISYGNAWVQVGGASSGGEYQNVKRDNAAAGDGVADDTAEIHAARDAAGVGGVVYFPAGTYLVTGLVANLAKQQWLLAPGAEIKLAVVAAATNCIDVQANGVIINGGSINGNRTAQTKDTNGVYVNEGLSDVTVEGVHIHSQNLDVNSGSGVRVKALTGTACQRIRVHKCRFSDNEGHDAYFNWETIDSFITDNVFEGTVTANANAVWVGNQSVRCNITGNTIQNSGRMGIEVWTGCDGSVVANNIVRNTVAFFGISIAAGDEVVVSNNRVSNCFGYAIEIAVSTRCAVIGNVIDGNGLTTTGIRLGNSSLCSVLGNKIKGIPAGATNQGIIVYADAVVTPPTANDNIVAHNSVEFVGPGQGIHVEANAATAVVSRNLVQGNRIKGDATANSIGIGVVNNVVAGVTDHNVVRDNIIESTYYGVYQGFDANTRSGPNTFITVVTPSTLASSIAAVRDDVAVGNPAVATVAVGILARKLEVFDESGTSLGFVAVYASIS